MTREFIEDLDKAHTTSYLRATPKGKALYERLEWKDIGTFNPDLMDFGLERENFVLVYERNGA